LAPKKEQLRSAPKICAEVPTIAALKDAIHANVDEIYFGGFLRSITDPNLDTAKQALDISRENQTPITLVLPRIMKDEECTRNMVLRLADIGAGTFLVGDMGTLELVKELGLTVYLDASFNVFNRLARNLLFDYAPRITVSQELHLSQIARIAGGAGGEVECIVQGPITLMFSEQCPISNSLFQGDKTVCRNARCNNQYFLKDRQGSLYPIRCDENLNSHIVYTKDICLIEYVPELRAAGVDVFRIRCPYHSVGIVGELIRCYSKALRIDKNDIGADDEMSHLKKRIHDLLGRETSEGKLLSGVE
jgi:putative protease